ncbi:MAG: peptidoglycan editing factor PgeF [Bryobacterales bacterium]|nr:peptidoglycan editing factor PgeF [Bryobacterales bacterium]
MSEFQHRAQPSAAALRDAADCHVLTSPLLEQFSWLRHGFGTRAGPLTQAGMASLKQIHSSVVLIANRPEGCIGEGDALLAAQRGVTVSVRTADCLPILLADAHSRAVAAIHAGWRGTAARIVPDALQRMHREFGTLPQNVFAAVGPGIGVCCYEVGEEVARLFGHDQAGKIDLLAENRRQLQAAGVPPRQIDVLSACTFCNPALFYSWRRDRDPAARMISYMGIR